MYLPLYVKVETSAKNHLSVPRCLVYLQQADITVKAFFLRWSNNRETINQSQSTYQPISLVGCKNSECFFGHQYDHFTLFQSPMISFYTFCYWGVYFFKSLAIPTSAFFPPDNLGTHIFNLSSIKYSIQSLKKSLKVIFKVVLIMFKNKFQVHRVSEKMSSFCFLIFSIKDS